jgi:osmotically-inducible protein OsmY
MSKIGILAVSAFCAVTLAAQNQAGQTTAASGTTAAQSSQVSNSGDAQLTQQLQAQFSQEPAFANVQVSVTKGIATLTGTVAKKTDRTRAEQLAKSAKGVSRVSDRITINASASQPSNGPTNAAAETPSTSASGSSGAVAATPSESTPHENDGTSASTQARQSSQAGATAAGTSSNAPATGASESALPNSDAGISTANNSSLQGQIQTALQNEPTLRNDTVNVTVNETTVELSGAVQSSKEKTTARRIASSFAGNRSVKDRITVNAKSPVSANPGTDFNNPASRSNTNPQAERSNQKPNTNPAAAGDASGNPR